MKTRAGIHGALLTVAVTTMVVTGCAAPASPSSASAPASSTPPVAPSPVGFSLNVLPATFVGQAIGGQRVVLLVSATGSPSDGPVELTATAGSATVTIEPQPLSPGIVGEVTVVPKPVAEGSEPVALVVAIRGSRDGFEASVERTLSVSPGTDGLAAEAASHLAPFAAWLGTNRPEMGIDPGTAWQATPASWVLVVDHYAFFSREWEIELAWHVMIAPNDWSRIALRQRWTQTRPSVAFEISSVSAGAEPHEIAPPDAVWR